METGRFFQIKNDIEDCFGDPQETGKVGTDIEEGKCTWLIAICLQRASSDQLKIIENCYGQKGAV